TIVRLLNQRACGHPVHGISAGATQRAIDAATARQIALPLARGVSVGGARGIKERAIIKAGLVEAMDIYELSDSRIRQGQAESKAANMEDRIRYFREDALLTARKERYELVYWNNALHHMFDVFDAIAWSHAVLRRGGLFLMDDFTGPDRFQFSSASLDIASAIRAELPTKYLRHADHLDREYKKKLVSIDPKALAAADPSEAADSGRILDAVKAYFPQADVVSMGGVVYNLALKDIVVNFDEADAGDRARLETLLSMDAVLDRNANIDTHYTIAIAFKNGPLDLSRVAAARIRSAARRLQPRRIRDSARHNAPAWVLDVLRRLRNRK
ncbi:MAG: hypothetical protein AAF449_20110, partial [Myxococcota bacterium]